MTKRMDLRDFARDLLTAEMLMRPLDMKLGVDSNPRELNDHMNAHDFDCYVMAVPEAGPNGDGDQYQTLKYVLRSDAAEAAKSGDKSVKGKLRGSFPSEKIMGERTSLGEVAKALYETGGTRKNGAAIVRLPVLVRTPSEKGGWAIITISDFAGAAGLAATLCIVGILDAQLATALRNVDADVVEENVGPEAMDVARGVFAEKSRCNEEISLVDCLTFGPRIKACRDLLLSNKTLKNQSQLINSTRNALMHGNLDGLRGDAVLDAFIAADAILEELSGDE